MDARCTRILERAQLPDLLGERRLVAIWIFGSHARGQAREDSDLDLGVLCEPPLGLDRARWMDVLSREAGVEVDVIDLRTASATLAWEAITTGQLVVERDPLAVERFMRDARFGADDEACRNRMIVLAQTPRIGSDL